ncbi:DUF3566 domain-containing protein [Pseudonocardia asaccharolytica]|uniref:DUF3566 domain-containing protein n=1 Tax=Pseudonocardia asaccharolytica DSM 44247 = NBRC 16224 TaxID=1123024 RepID=A0A511DCD8_9PSEU|nr:DUF3566 domain-containing protein [Pseudonocardia asaccharolytica]GEL20618.1 hypothetical protein PA7_44550 [Pseudonocardia asaccharolytica DSM 44247 = NBRC 16224]
MSDTNSSDEEPDGGRLATGGQPAGKAGADGPSKSEKTEGTVPEQTKPDEAEPPVSPAAEGTSDEAKPSPGAASNSDRADGAGPAPTAAASSGSGNGRSDGAGPVSPGSDDPAGGRRPTPAPRQAAAPHATPPPTRAGADSKPAPPPGPAAEAPPPWRRIPGEDISEPPTVVHSRPVAGGLLDAPTAFIDRPTEVLTAPDHAGGAEGGHDGSGAEANGSVSTVRTSRGRPPRQAALQLKRLDPWSVLKLAGVLAVVLFFIWLVAVGVLYGILDGMGVWDRLNGTYADLVSGETHSGSTLISAGPVFGFAAVVGAINSLLFAVALTIGAFVYNVSADLVGGIEVTLSERD